MLNLDSSLIAEMYCSLRSKAPFLSVGAAFGGRTYLPFNWGSEEVFNLASNRVPLRGIMPFVDFLNFGNIGKYKCVLLYCLFLVEQRPTRVL
jgi:hypothetical protein